MSYLATVWVIVVAALVTWWVTGEWWVFLVTLKWTFETLINTIRRF